MEDQLGQLSLELLGKIISFLSSKEIPTLTCLSKCVHQALQQSLPTSILICFNQRQQLRFSRNKAVFRETALLRKCLLKVESSLSTSIAAAWTHELANACSDAIQSVLDSSHQLSGLFWTDDAGHSTGNIQSLIDLGVSLTRALQKSASTLRVLDLRGNFFQMTELRQSFEKCDPIHMPRLRRLFSPTNISLRIDCPKLQHLAILYLDNDIGATTSIICDFEHLVSLEITVAFSTQLDLVRRPIAFPRRYPQLTNLKLGISEAASAFANALLSLDMPRLECLQVLACKHPSNSISGASRLHRKCLIERQNGLKHLNLEPNLTTSEFNRDFPSVHLNALNSLRCNLEVFLEIGNADWKTLQSLVHLEIRKGLRLPGTHVSTREELFLVFAESINARPRIVYLRLPEFFSRRLHDPRREAPLSVISHVETLELSLSHPAACQIPFRLPALRSLVVEPYVSLSEILPMVAEQCANLERICFKGSVVVPALRWRRDEILKYLRDDLVMLREVLWEPGWIFNEHEFDCLMDAAGFTKAKGEANENFEGLFFDRHLRCDYLHKRCCPLDRTGVGLISGSAIRWFRRRENECSKLFGVQKRKR